MTVNMNEKYNNALAFATQKHNGQYRIGGEPYIVHPIAVAKIVKDNGGSIDYQIAALFHDLLEDTDAKEEEIERYGNKDILVAVKLMTKTPGYVIGDYISKIKANDMAFAVKKADRLHNLKSAFCTDDNFKRKYIAETNDWYLDFSDEIKAAVQELAKSVESNK